MNPEDKQSFGSVLRICDLKVINLLNKVVNNSEANITFLQIMSDVIAAFMDTTLTPIDRIEKMWYSVFLVRLWRTFVLKKRGLTLKDNFMSIWCYYCIELNAHSLVLILLYLKENHLEHLFFAHKLCSQPCEEFFRQKVIDHFQLSILLLSTSVQKKF